MRFQENKPQLKLRQPQSTIWREDTRQPSNFAKARQSEKLLCFPKDKLGRNEKGLEGNLGKMGTLTPGKILREIKNDVKRMNSNPTRKKMDSPPSKEKASEKE